MSFYFVLLLTVGKKEFFGRSLICVGKKYYLSFLVLKQRKRNFSNGRTSTILEYQFLGTNVRGHIFQLLVLKNGTISKERL